MKTLKLALVGKNISHSKSQQMYEELLNTKVEYSLLDYESESEIPPAKDLLNIYDGISITAPYKKHFLKECSVQEDCSELNAINCLRLKNKIVEATNTDYLAVLGFLNTILNNKSSKVVILGDGSMSFMTQKILRNNSIEFEVISRKIHGDISHINLSETLSSNYQTKLVINTCSRGFIFAGELPKDSIFWDYNYNYSEHSSTIPKICCKYIDGIGMLKDQARHALTYWEILPD